jgi:hypothetical protein
MTNGTCMSMVLLADKEEDTVKMTVRFRVSGLSEVRIQRFLMHPAVAH